jgi:pyruvate decarboxylase
LTAREISTIVRYGLRPTIVLITNRGRTIKAEIHHSLYNQIKNWQHTGLLEVFNAWEGKGFGLRAATVAEPVRARERALAHRRTLPDSSPF